MPRRRVGLGSRSGASSAWLPSRSPIHCKLLTVTGGVSVLAAVIASFAYAARLEAQLESLRDPGLDGRPLALWAHRGGPGAPPNSAQALDHARAAGYSGVELDVRWVEDRGLVCAHDPVQPGQAPPSLGDLLRRHGDAFVYWLDFKTLTAPVAERAGPRLDALVRELRLSQRCFVEAADARALARLREHAPGIRPLLRATPWRRLRPGPGYLALLGDLHRHRIGAVSWPARDLDGGDAERLAPLLLLTFTVDDPARIDALDALGIEVALTDELPP